MGSQCCKPSTSSSKYIPDSSVALLSYKKSEPLRRNNSQLVRKKSIDINSKEPVPQSIRPVRKQPPNKSLQYPKPSLIKNYLIVWLTSNIDEDDNAINYLQNMFNSFRLFTNIDEFFAFILEMKEEKLFLIISEKVAEKILSFIHKMSQLITIYIISNDKSNEEQWIKQYRKIEGVFTNIELICKSLQYKIHLSENEISPNEIINSSKIIIQHLIIQILLYETDYNEKSKQDFLHFARTQYPNELNIINEFEETYTPSKAIWWYTRKCFLYSAMNKAFRTENLELLINMGFFIRDLHQQIDQSYEEINQTTDVKIVYRGQGISENDLEMLKHNKNGFFTFKNFLWTYTDESSSLHLAQSARNTGDLFGVLFRIELTSSITHISLDKFSYYLNSKSEILFSIYSLFRIGKIKQIEEKIWQIDLILMDNNDLQLKDYLNRLEAIEGELAWQQLGFYFIQLNQLNKADVLYKTLMNSNSITDPKQLSLLYEQLGFIYHKKNDSTNSLLYYKLSLKTYLTFSSQNDSNLLPIYLNIGILLQQQRSSNEALKHLKYALNIALHSSSLDHLQIATIYYHIAEIYEDQRIFLDASQYYQLALESELNHVPLDYLSITKTYHKIGDIFYQLENYTTAFSYFDKTLKIQKKTLPPNHSLLAITNYNVARALHGLHRYKEAIEYVSQAVNIARHSFGSNHDDVRLYENYLNKLQQKTLINVIPNGAVYE